MRKCLLALIAMFPGAVLAVTVWTWVDEQGLRHFSDTAVPGAVQMEIGQSQSFSGSALRRSQAPTRSSAPEATRENPAAYSILDVISPEPEQTFWNIGGELPVTLATFPALRPEHRIDLVLDGTRRDLDTRSLGVTLSEVWRGEHTLQALIIDAEGSVVMRSAPVTFFVQQTSILN